MKWHDGLRQPGVLAALTAAVLFGAGTPLAKQLLNTVSPWLLAGLLYFGSGAGLALYRLISRAEAVSLPRNERLWFIGAITAGGIIAPVLLMIGLTGMPASGASLLLNAEGVFTALLAWFAFKENFDRRIALGMIVIVAGAAILSWPGDARFAGWWPTLAILGACFAWGIDNNLTRKVSLTDATWIASAKGLVAGIVNLGLAFVLGATLPPLTNLAGALLVGFFAYGVSLALFVIGLRHLGTARTGAYFSIAPFLGAVLAVIMGDTVTMPLIVAGLLMAVGIALHLTEQHAHQHIHDELMHEHEHHHDEHHQHTHDFPVADGVAHKHHHQHRPLAHSHPHYPDSHHRHKH
ncbi:cobalt-nickel resistance (export) protein [Yersinia intermedia]|jgi:drug/metabolite transporter (DMT)-like permease|uniref:EamA family transporter n=1 Tax=Yersinia intermedia TaxID=631 RepID=A0A209AAN2_YERIN|nr:DMT family transporter [Yersinia intermedia]MCB5320489.1 DMT family transporter [Yersinia intermedia]OVZ89573.1 EamA family transporter [Yersinia intermedia]UNK21603.1 DMT family transporter [Yersinia intermedia]UZM69200.1 DMT family transporter [Yersinia intermedia]WET13584.1 DMT family transporter [Yersinia intermedia]